MAIQLSESREQLNIRKRDISDVGQATFLQWANFINRYIYRKLLSTDAERFIGEQAYAVSNPSTQPLPTDFRDINTLGTGFFFCDQNGRPTERRLVRQRYGASQVGYYINRSEVNFVGINDSRTFMLRYSPKLVTFTSNDQYFTLDGTEDGVEIIPEEYMEYVVNALDVQYSMWDEEVGAESVADQRFVRVLDELIDNIKQEPYAYSIPDFSSQFSASQNEIR